MYIYIYIYVCVCVCVCVCVWYPDKDGNNNSNTNTGCSNEFISFLAQCEIKTALFDLKLSCSIILTITVTLHVPHICQKRLLI